MSFLIWIFPPFELSSKMHIHKNWLSNGNAECIHSNELHPQCWKTKSFPAAQKDFIQISIEIKVWTLALGYQVMGWNKLKTLHVKGAFSLSSCDYQMPIEKLQQCRGNSAASEILRPAAEQVAWRCPEVDTCFAWHSSQSTESVPCPFVMV